MSYSVAKERNAMLKDIDDRDEESARRRAERKWRNHDLQKRILDEIKLAQAEPKGPKSIEIADTIKNEELKKGTLVRAQTKFAKEIREMLEGHTKRNAELYLHSLQMKRKRLLVEKLRRLKLAQEPQT
jgi:hypothetical protein